MKSISKICFWCLLLWSFGSYLTWNFRENCLDFCPKNCSRKKCWNFCPKSNSRITNVCLIFCLSFQNQTSEWYSLAFEPIDQHAHQPPCLLLLLWRLFGCFFKASPNYILNVGTRHSYPSLVFSDGWCVWWHWLWCQSRSQCNLCPPPPAPETGHSRHQCEHLIVLIVFILPLPSPHRNIWQVFHLLVKDNFKAILVLISTQQWIKRNF